MVPWPLIWLNFSRYDRTLRIQISRFPPWGSSDCTRYDLWLPWTILMVHTKTSIQNFWLQFWTILKVQIESPLPQVHNIHIQNFKKNAVIFVRNGLNSHSKYLHKIPCTAFHQYFGICFGSQTNWFDFWLAFMDSSGLCVLPVYLLCARYYSNGARSSVLFFYAKSLLA